MLINPRCLLLGLLLLAACGDDTGNNPPPPPPVPAPPPPPPPPPAPNSWVQRDSIPGGGVAGASSFVIDERLYVVNGIRTGFSSQVYRYDPADDSWAQLFPTTAGSRASGIGFAIGSYGYMGLGYNCFGVGLCTHEYFKDLWRLDPATGQWTRMADFPGTARAYAAAFVIGDKAYVTGGSTVTDIDTWQYDPATNSWTQKADFPGACSARNTVFTIGTTGYVGLGIGVNGLCKKFWAYDTTANAWTAVDSFPGAARYDAVGFSIGDTAFVVGAVVAPGQVTEVWTYSASANTWSQRQTTYPGMAVVELIAGVVAGRIFLGLGASDPFGGPDERHADFWEYGK